MLQRSHAAVSCLVFWIELLLPGIGLRAGAWAPSLRAGALAIVLTLAFAVRPAIALEEHQKAAIDRLAADASDARSLAAILSRHYAMLLWVEDYCDGRSSESVRAYIQEKGAADQEAFDAGWANTVETMSKTEPKAMCALALELYGPEGTMIKGAWDLRLGAGR